MNRIVLILLLGFSMLISFSVQADGRGRHYNKHHHGHHNKHQVRYNHRQRHHHSHGHQSYGCGHASHYAYGAYPGLSSVGYIAFDTRHGVSAGGEVVVRMSYP